MVCRERYWPLSPIRGRPSFQGHRGPARDQGPRQGWQVDLVVRPRYHRRLRSCRRRFIHSHRHRAGPPRRPRPGDCGPLVDCARQRVALARARKHGGHCEAASGRGVDGGQGDGDSRVRAMPRGHRCQARRPSARARVGAFVPARTVLDDRRLHPRVLLGGPTAFCKSAPPLPRPARASSERTRGAQA